MDVMGSVRSCRYVPLCLQSTHNFAECTAALMEYHVTKATDVASRIFEKGMETFGDEIDYVLRYLGFLISVNDNNSESRVTLIPIMVSQPIYLGS
jgi:hypothetical protein